MAQVAIRRVEKYFGTTRVIHGVDVDVADEDRATVDLRLEPVAGHRLKVGGVDERQLALPRRIDDGAPTPADEQARLRRRADRSAYGLTGQARLTGFSRATGIARPARPWRGPPRRAPIA